MMQQQYLEYIQRQLAILTQNKSKEAALLYSIGFLEAQLARAMYNDSHVAQEFKNTLNKLGYSKPKQ